MLELRPFSALPLVGAYLLVSMACQAPSATAGPLLEWNFDGETGPGVWIGEAIGKQSDAAGPRAPRYPRFDGNNLAGRFPGGNSGILVRDHEKGGTADVRFRAGDSITFESWVRVDQIGPGQMVYLAGKGRHGKLGQDLGETNQNYAFRLAGTDKGTQLGFLFTSENPADGKREWHRWWSNARLPDTGWHHVALVYTFGKGDSLRAYIDGEQTDGVWDLGGKTDLPPVADADDLLIGTGYQRKTGQSFVGWMDDIAIHREALPAERFVGIYEYVPPPPPVTKSMISEGKILVQISERGVPEANVWPDEPEVTESHEEEFFGFFELPQKYISTGVREDRANPSHFRASAVIDLPKGKHRLLLRGRGAAKLIIDGETILENPFPKPDTGGHGYLSEQDGYLDLGPDFRFVPPGNRESWIEFETEGGEHFVILETMIGGVAGKNKRRPEIGETVVAWSPEGSESWQLLTPGEREVPYTDEGWAAYEAERKEWLAATNAAAREARRGEHAEYWAMRRAAAQEWLAASDPVTVPALPEGYPANNEIDHFLGDRIARGAADAKTAAGGTVDYFDQVQPLLEAKCYDCHAGGKVKGDLRLDLASAAHAGGESDGPAVVPGDLDASSLIYRISEDAGDDIMPPKGDPLSADEVALLAKWIEEGAAWPEFEVADFRLTPLADDLVFLRRIALDTVGVPPTEEEIAAFRADTEPGNRDRAIDRYLADPRWADRWMGYWQDVLAENPNIINPTLNNTGPFRWWLHESLLDNKPADLFVTELVRMEGSERFGGPAGFGTASQNDVPMAAKGIILGSAFLGVEMKCARCHDAPAHVSKQADLFGIAAMLAEKPVSVPATSSVPMDKIHEGGRKPLIEVTLPPGSEVAPAWPFADFAEEDAASLAADSEDPRDKLAALITAPQNERFAQVVVNRIWQKLMGRGIVETVSDWEKSDPTHPELLRWLGREFVASGYDMKAVARLILQSHAYQRATDPRLEETGPLHIAPAPRRLDAEQIVDSLFSATGAPFDLEEVSLDVDSVRVLNNSITLGQPERAWMLASTSNERDRPSLSLPRIQAVASVMETFGWRGARQDPVSLRDVDPNLLQPAILANGTMGVWLTRLSDDHGITSLALEDQPVERLVERLFLRLLTREPSASEIDRYVEVLQDGYSERVVPESERARPSVGKREPVRYVSWSNHLDPDANTLAVEREEQARAGAAPTTALRDDWRLRLEDVVWAMINSPEWIYAP